MPARETALTVLLSTSALVVATAKLPMMLSPDWHETATLSVLLLVTTMPTLPTTLLHLLKALALLVVPPSTILDTPVPTSAPTSIFSALLWMSTLPCLVAVLYVITLFLRYGNGLLTLLLIQGYKTGTSMATPHVVGLAAYLAARDGKRASPALCKQIQDSALRNMITDQPSNTVNLLAFNGNPSG